MRNTKEYPVTADECINAVEGAFNNETENEISYGSMTPLALHTVLRYLRERRLDFEAYLKVCQ